jgi:hypothetical protein
VLASSSTLVVTRLSHLVPATSWAVTHVLITDEGAASTATIREGRCVSVSNGSFKNQYGTSAWAIEAESSVDRRTGVDIPPAAVSKENRGKEVNILPGSPTDENAYRSEVAGLLGIAPTVREICAFHDITAGTVYLGCDGLSALLCRCTDIDHVDHDVKPTAPHFDLITATRTVPGIMDTASRSRASRRRSLYLP